MRTSFPVLVPLLAAALLSGCATVPEAEKRNDGKNLADVVGRTYPSDFERLLVDDLDGWNFNFRPYGRTSDLVSDPSIIRGVQSDASAGGYPTALRTMWDENGFTLLVFCGDTSGAACLREGKDLPLPRLEIYISPNDADNRDVASYWMFFQDGSRFTQYDFLVNDRTWRFMSPYVATEMHPVRNGYVFRLSIAWEGLWDRLPFLSEKKDNLWRLKVVRWAGGGLTWGGEVHMPMRSGYLRWPAFTAAERASVLRRVLERGWSDYCRHRREPCYNVSKAGWSAARVRTEPWHVAEVEANGPRSYINYTEDPAVRPELENIVAEADALGKGIADFGTMDEAAQLDFYRKAAPKLFNFRYDVEAASAARLKAKIVGEQ